MIQIKNRIVFSDEGKMIRRIGAEVYVTAMTTFKDETAADFEELDEVPKYTREEYNREVEKLIAERYTTGQEIQFAREREEAGEKYAEYLAFIEDCKVKAKESLSNRESLTLFPDL